MNAPNQALICNPQIEWSELLSFPFQPFRVSSCVNVYVFDREKNARRRNEKKKKRKKEKKQTNSIARIRARTSPPAVSFSCLKLHYAAKETKYKILCHDQVTRLKQKHFSRGFKSK